ncbi:hypothetical protein BDQ12DRAFT_666639 [Crucibulum laeve]|uniref:Uncharacterized protein n=1 Tax=Crucibulum laeve TaxID=68775 RepID=A0A5C3LXS8_9AGAR|nr:hypothetical protein BDQ12DRAFT_666639 [Crucibulum laeve]
MSFNPAPFLLPDSEKYEGVNWIEFRTTLLSAVRARGLLPYLEGSLLRPPDTILPRPTTAWWGVKTEGTVAETWKSLTDAKDVKNDLTILSAENSLNAIKYTEGSNLEDHFSRLRTAWKKAVGAGSNIDVNRFRMVLKSMPTSWSIVLASLNSNNMGL